MPNLVWVNWLVFNIPRPPWLVPVIVLYILRNYKQQVAYHHRSPWFTGRFKLFIPSHSWISFEGVILPLYTFPIVWWPELPLMSQII